MYSQAQYYIWRQRLAFFLGGRQYLQATLYPFRLNFFIDIWPYRLTFENYIDYDILGNKEICTAGFTYSDVARILIYFQLDY